MPLTQRDTEQTLFGENKENNMERKMQSNQNKKTHLRLEGIRIIIKLTIFVLTVALVIIIVVSKL